jgi:hypothetical protein
MRIDIGAKSKEAAAAKVKVGDYAAFVTSMRSWRAGRPRPSARRSTTGPVAPRSSNCCGASDTRSIWWRPSRCRKRSAARGQGRRVIAPRPDAALMLECTPAYDLPNDKDVSPNVALGKGPSIYVMDARTIQDPRWWPT